MARTTTVRLLTADYADRLDALYREAVALEQKAEKSDKPRRLNDQPDYVAKAVEYQALKAEAEAQAITVTLKAIGRKEWRALKASHPPRTTHDDPEVVKQDRLAGVNVETVEDDLVHTSLLEPADKACAQDMRHQGEACSRANPCAHRAAFDEWADELSEAEFQTVLAHAWSLANTVRVDPKSLPALPTLNGAPSDG